MYLYTHILYHKNQFTIVLCVNFFFMKLKNETEQKKHTEMELYFIIWLYNLACHLVGYEGTQH